MWFYYDFSLFIKTDTSMHIDTIIKEYSIIAQHSSYEFRKYNVNPIKICSNELWEKYYKFSAPFTAANINKSEILFSLFSDTTYSETIFLHYNVKINGFNAHNYFLSFEVLVSSTLYLD